MVLWWIKSRGSRVRWVAWSALLATNYTSAQLVGSRVSNGMRAVRVGSNYTSARLSGINSRVPNGMRSVPGWDQDANWEDGQ